MIDKTKKTICLVKDYFLREHGKVFFGYMAISTIATLIDFLLLYLFTSLLGIFYLLSAVFSYVIGNILSYFLNRTFNFKKVRKSVYVQYLFFIFFGLVGLLLNILILYILVNYLLIYYLFAKIISVGIVFFWNYLCVKYIVFS